MQQVLSRFESSSITCCICGNKATGLQNDLVELEPYREYDEIGNLVGTWAQYGCTDTKYYCGKHHPNQSLVVVAGIEDEKEQLSLMTIVADVVSRQ